MDRYLEVGSRIFAKHLLSDLRLVFRKVQKAAIKRSEKGGLRPFTEVRVLTQHLTGLLETRASVSPLGKDG